MACICNIHCRSFCMDCIHPFNIALYGVAMGAAGLCPAAVRLALLCLAGWQGPVAASQGERSSHDVAGAAQCCGMLLCMLALLSCVHEITCCAACPNRLLYCSIGQLNHSAVSDSASRSSPHWPFALSFDAPHDIRLLTAVGPSVRPFCSQAGAAGGRAAANAVPAVLCRQASALEFSADVWTTRHWQDPSR